MNESEEPEQERIRALLAELGTGGRGEPVPPDVAARLDDTLAGLVAERRAGEATGGATTEATGGASDGASDGATSGASVVPLRRRLLPRLAVAAAVLAVLGAGAVTALDHGLGGGGAGSSTSADSAGSGTGKSAAVPQEATAVPALHSASFARDVTLLLRGRPDLRGPASRIQAPSDSAGAAGAAGCPIPVVASGSTALPVLYDGRPAILVVGPARTGQRLVEVRACDGHRLDRAQVRQP